jgi:tetratricopeptide (TPR) repeat protein
LGDQSKAQQSFKDAAGGEPARTRRLAGGDFPVLSGPQPYYRGLALKKLGEEAKAKELFAGLVKSGTQALEQRTSRGDFFSSFGDRQSQRERLAAAHYLIALGNLGLGDKEKAKEHFSQALQASPDHLGAKTQLTDLR